MTIIAEEFENLSTLEDVTIYNLLNVQLAEYENSSALYTIVSVLCSEFVNTSTLQNVSNIRFSFRGTEFVNTSTLEDASVNSSTKIFTQTFNNVSILESLGDQSFAITAETFSNTSVFEYISTTFNQIVETSEFSNAAELYRILVITSKVDVVPPRPAEINRSKFDKLNNDEKLTTTTQNLEFSDFSLHFKPHPLTGAPALVFNEASINQSLRMILYTDVYERPFSNINFGASIKKMLFETFTPSLRNDLVTIILELVTNNERRIIVKNISVTEESRHSLVIIIEYKIKKTGQIGKFIQALERA